MSGLFLGAKHERGDTIVEVMISLIVISSVIVGAFLVSRTSTRNIRSSEEHSQALNLLQGQVELLRVYAESSPAKTPVLPADLSTKFCMVNDGTYSNDVSSASSPCKIANSPTGSSYTYDLSVLQTKAAVPSANLAATYTFSVSWPGQDGTTSRESFVYRPAIVGS